MTDSPDQAALREHLAELRHTARAIGRDIALHAEDIDRKIDRLGHTVGKDAKYLSWELEDDLSALRKDLSKGIRAVPGAIADGASAIKDSAVNAAERVGDATHAVAHRAAEGTRDAFAAAAGVRRRPMREWHTPGAADADEG